jgi:hypothetical protein
MAKSKNTICPSNKFSVFSGCITWNSVLAVIFLIAILFMIFAIMLQNSGISFNKYSGAMVDNDISNTSGMYSKYNKNLNNGNNKIYESKKNSFEPNDYKYNKHDNTGTPSSERIKYDINLNIRDVDSYRQNPNTISYGQYEASKNMERIINPLLPPERSYVNTYGIPINIPSRGPLQTYQQIGILYKENVENPNTLPGNNSESNILPLFGRPTYSGSNKWNYYTSSDKFQTVKLPINIDGHKCTNTLGCNELRNGDTVSIPSYNGKFKVEIYELDTPQYIPYVY